MATTKNLTSHKIKRYRVLQKDRSTFINDLALLLRANVSVSEAISSIRTASQSRTLRKVLAQVQEKIDDGTPLWKSLEQSGLVSDYALVLIRLGESSGNLVENLRKAADQEDKQHLFRTKVRSALLYPAIVLTMTFISGLGVAWFLLPKFAESFGQLDTELPLISEVLLHAGVFFKDNGLWLMPLLLAASLAIGSLVLVIPSARRTGQHLQLYIPGVNRVLREIEVARFGYLLGTLLDAGLSVTDATKMLQDTTKSPQYKKFYKHLYNSFENGYSFKTALAKYKHANKILPPAVQQMLIAGERSGLLAETLINVGQTYEDKLEITTKNLQTILEPVLLVIIGIAVLMVMLAVLIPIYSFTGEVGG